MLIALSQTLDSAAIF